MPDAKTPTAKKTVKADVIPKQGSSRAEKRAQQRIANVGRAEKMHKARLAYARDQVQANLFADSSPNTKAKPTTTPQYHIGCSGWYYWDWKGKFYPLGLPTSQWFNYYMQSFDTVELNAPFYSWPTLATVRTWLRQAGDKSFVYTVKVCELVTHVKRFEGTKTLVKDFGFIADLLGERMGCFLYQLPPSYDYSPARLKAIISQLDPARRNVVEFRHASWWNDRVYDAFRAANIIFCSCSGPKLPDDLIKTADDIYVRFHGTQKWYRHDYSAEELADWATRIKASNAKRIWIYFNNDYDGYAIKNALTLSDLLNQSTKSKKSKSGR